MKTDHVAIVEKKSTRTCRHSCYILYFFYPRLSEIVIPRRLVYPIFGCSFCWAYESRYQTYNLAISRQTFYQLNYLAMKPRYLVIMLLLLYFFLDNKCKENDRFGRHEAVIASMYFFMKFIIYSLVKNIIMGY